jgi:hypothetical protein
MDIALDVFRRIQERFPHLTMKLDEKHPHVDAVLEIAHQPGLAFGVSLNLQNRDELHIVAGPIWCEWFPCTSRAKVDQYFDAVVGLIEGKYRILEHRRGTRVVKAELQKPVGSGWETVGRWLTLSLPWPKREIRVLQNSAAT